MAPVGSRECLAAAIHNGADSVYFGVGRLNMRAHSACDFSLADLRDIAAQCADHGVRSYLAVNTVIYGQDMDTMRRTIDAARETGISAVIASDVAVMAYCRSVGESVHLSTQLNIANIEALRFYARFADVAVLARELNLWQVRDIHEGILREGIKGPGGEHVRIEMFCHGALCMAISGKCYLSLHNAAGRSANRGECTQVCRRGYEVRDLQNGNTLNIDHQYILSPKDLKTIGFLDLMASAGVRVFKIEGRARGPEYVRAVVRAYDEALHAVADGTLQQDPQRLAQWDAELASVFNRGFWDGYYQGAPLGQWCETYGSKATEQKVYVGKCDKWFPRISVAEFAILNEPLRQGDKMLVVGNTTGAVVQTASEMRLDDGPTDLAQRGQIVAVHMDERVRPGDKLYVMRRRTLA